MRRILIATTSLAAFVVASCVDRSEPGGSDADRSDGVVIDSVSVFFTRDEEPVEVRRGVTGRAADIRATLELLLAGPDSTDRQQGISSFFSPATAGMLKSVEVDGSHVVVDFEDLRPVIPNASSSTGSTLLLQELNMTIFQFPELHSIEYLIDGSCAAFWGWLQYDCQTVTRPAV